MGGESLIVIDTHIWIWWIHDLPDLEPWMRECLAEHERDSICISAISCWEISLLASRAKLNLYRTPAEWFSIALNYPGVELVGRTPAISIDANYLPGDFHNDPADRIIVATARVLGCELLTADNKILNYADVKLAQRKP